jgi:FG-GAP-like repeat
MILQSPPRSLSACICKTFASITAVLFLALCAQAQISFNKPDFDTGKGPVSAAAADFNHDGLLDVVTANSRDNSISVLLNNGNATFGRRTDYPAGKNPQVVVTADFNGDGLPDVAVTNQDDSTISIFFGNGDGTLRLFTTFAVASHPNAMITADFNKDGKADLAVINTGSNVFSVFLGNGNGSFTHSADYPFGSGQSSFSSLAGIVAADLNGDGVLDLVVTNGSSDNVAIFLGKGDGTFRSAGNVTLAGGAAGFFDGRIVAADFNQDGKVDLLVQFVDCRQRGCADGVTAFAGHGDGTFDGGHPFPGSGFDPMIAVDVNGDHVPDVVTANVVVVVNPATVFSGAASKPMFTAGLGPAWLVGGDFNGDGKTDVVIANSADDTVSLLQGNGDGAFHQLLRLPYPDPDPIAHPDGIVTADFNRDGNADMVVKDTSFKGVWVYLGKGDGTFGSPTLMATDLEPFEIAAVDLNKDGIPDLLINGFLDNGRRGIIRVLLGNGDGTFRAPIDSDEPVGILEALRVADFNGDGIPDVIIRGPGPSSTTLNDSINVCFGNGDGSFRPAVQTTIPFASSGIEVGDFNRDGKMDAVVGFTNISSTNFESFVIYLGNGDGTFQVGQKYSAPGNPASFAAADMNHDGLLDLLVLHGHSLAVFLGNGDGALKQQLDTPIFGEPRQVQAVDLNGDGRLDALVSNDRISIFLGNGDGTLQPRQDFATGGALAAAVGDFNRDAAPDIAVASTNFVRGSISLLLSGTLPLGRDFHLNLNPTSATVKAGQSANLTLSLVAIGAFSDSVTFSCTGLPAGATCSFNPSGVAPGTNGQATSALIISTQARSSSALLPVWNGRFAATFWLPVAGMVLAGIRTRKRSRLLVLSFALLLGLLLLQGCAGITGSGSSGGGSGNGNGGGLNPGGSGTPSGTFMVTVTGTSGGSSPITHSVPLTLNVQ